MSQIKVVMTIGLQCQNTSLKPWKLSLHQSSLKACGVELKKASKRTMIGAHKVQYRSARKLMKMILWSLMVMIEP